MRIEACFDSHVHWAACGEFKYRLRLEELKSPSHIAQLKITPQHMRGDWLLGFGWDESSWPERPHRSQLDRLYPTTPVAFSRCDGHALWLNSEALRRAEIFDLPAEKLIVDGGRVEIGADSKPTGLLVDKAVHFLDRVIPRASVLELRRYLLQATKYLNNAGFTHIRDMTCDETQWNEAIKLDESGLLTLAVEEYFWLKDVGELDHVVDLAKRARSQQTANLRVQGLKVFVDGALGSEGAWLSRCYHGKNHKGSQLWTKDALQEVIRKSWEQKFSLALHVIGDEAVDFVIGQVVQVMASGLKGKIHLEHCELVRPQTLEKMRSLDVECHLQPGHWLNDQRWLKQKVGELEQFAFPWRKMQELDIAFDFGSDAPLDQANLGRIFEALRLSADAGIPRLLGQPTTCLQHRDLSWAPNSYTLLEEDQPVQVVFRGEHLV